MENFIIIDAHVHTYKTPEIAAQAMGGQSRVGCLGTPEELLQIMNDAGIIKAVQVNMTPAFSMFNALITKQPPENREKARFEAVQTITGRIQRRNEWTCELSKANERLIPFPSVDPIMGSLAMVSELEDKVKNYGAKGLKLHPAEGCYFPDDPVLWPVYETAQRLKIPVISHGGLFLSDKDYTRPINFIKVLESFPELTFVIAHLGAGFWDESIDMAKKYSNLYFDTSAAIHGDDVQKPLSDEEAVTIIRKIGVEKIMFGSDFPWYHPGRSLKRILGIGLSEKEKRAILAENAVRIYNL